MTKKQLEEALKYAMQVGITFIPGYVTSDGRPFPATMRDAGCDCCSEQITIEEMPEEVRGTMNKVFNDLKMEDAKREADRDS